MCSAWHWVTDCDYFFTHNTLKGHKRLIINVKSTMLEIPTLNLNITFQWINRVKHALGGIVYVRIDRVSDYTVKNKENGL